MKNEKILINIIKWWFLIFGVIYAVVMTACCWDINVICITLCIIINGVAVLSILSAFMIERTKRYKLLKAFFLFRAIYSIFVGYMIFAAITIIPGKRIHYFLLILPLISMAFSIFYVVWLNKRICSSRIRPPLSAPEQGDSHAETWTPTDGPQPIRRGTREGYK